MQKNDTHILAITSGELVPKEASHHASCHWVYTSPTNEKLSIQPSNDSRGERFWNVWKHFCDLFDNPRSGNSKHFKTWFKIFSDSVRNLRQEIIDIQFSMQQPPERKDLKVTHFKILNASEFVSHWCVSFKSWNLSQIALPI